MDWIRGRQHQIPVCRADNLSFYQCKKSNYQREGFIIQCEGLDEATGEKERPVSVQDMSLARIVIRRFYK